jgi:trehalose/maltose transport system permease protein
LLNSALVAGGVTILSLAIGSLAAFALGRFRFRGRSLVMYLMLSMTMFPSIAILGALYTMISGFGVGSSSSRSSTTPSGRSSSPT